MTVFLGNEPDTILVGTWVISGAWCTDIQQAEHDRLRAEGKRLSDWHRSLVEEIAAFNDSVKDHNTQVQDFHLSVKTTTNALSTLTKNLPGEDPESVRRLVEIQMVYKLTKLLELLQ